MSGQCPKQLIAHGHPYKGWCSFSAAQGIRHFLSLDPCLSSVLPSGVQDLFCLCPPFPPPRCIPTGFRSSWLWCITRPVSVKLGGACAPRGWPLSIHSMVSYPAFASSKPLRREGGLALQNGVGWGGVGNYLSVTFVCRPTPTTLLTIIKTRKSQ